MPSWTIVVVHLKTTTTSTIPGNSRSLVGVFVDTSSGPINGSISWLVAALRLEDGRLVEDALIFCRVKLYEECLPLLDELEKVR